MHQHVLNTFFSGEEKGQQIGLWISLAGETDLSVVFS
jgi:hypothetical protein